MASTSKTMESSTVDAAASSDSSEIPPAWMQQYLLKMKNEIKKEILEELFQAPQGEVQYMKAGSATKLEENPLDFQGEVIHTGIFCDNCDQLIHGIRYKCGNCSDFDLCQECESLPNIHNKNHIFLKIRYPFALKLYQTQKWQEFTSGPAGKIYMRSRNHQTKKLYEAKFVRDETIPDGTVLPPSTKFVKSWKVVNSGTRVWTHATKLQLIQGSADLVPLSDHVDVQHLKPGEEGIVSVVFTTPALPGVYRSHWNFCHRSRPFGDIVWCHIMVYAEKIRIDNLLLEKTDVNVSPEKAVENKQSEVSCIAQVLTAVKKEHERGNMVPRKLVVTSHTATPNNTPFDLTPPKSPEHHETSVKEVHNTTPSSISPAKGSENEDDECSVVSLGSSESDTEFVVIPMPKCFNLSESFISQNIPRWMQDVTQEAADEDPPKAMYENMQVGKLELPILTTENIQSQNVTRKLSLASETVSQETGVPELSENTCEQTLLKFVEQQTDTVKMNCVSVITDGSSSEISIIESEEASPNVENTTQTIGSINISMSSGSVSNRCELDRVEVHLDNAPLNESAVGADKLENEEEAVDIPFSATFPKFPVEGITSTFDPAPASNEERTIQVLPEGLVTGALSAAASVYNTARAAINAMQQPRVERGVVLSQELPESVGNNSAPHSTVLNPMDQLTEMGFCNRQQNEDLLKKHNGDVPLVVAELVNLNDNEWYASRHVPSPPPCFD